MSVFHLFDARGHKFNRDPVAVKSQFGKGWVIKALSEDPNLYNGLYAKIVGFADDAPNHSHIAFRLKRDAKAALAEAQNLGLLK